MKKPRTDRRTHTAMVKKKNKRIPPLILILICDCMLFEMYIRLSKMALAIWGESLAVDRYDADATMPFGRNRSRTISKGTTSDVGQGIPWLCHVHKR